MAAIDRHESHYIPGGYNSTPTPDNPLTIFCMDDGAAEDPSIGPADVQVAGSLYGFGHDWALTQVALNGHNLLLDVPLVTVRAARRLGPIAVARLHGGGCAGERVAPYSPRLVASADPDELLKGVQELGLNLGETPVKQAIAVNKRYASTRPSPIPSMERAAEIVENHPDARLQRIPLARSDHLAPALFSDLSQGDVYDTRAAWEKHHPSYSISFGKFGRLASRIENRVLSDEEEAVLLAVSAVRHLVTAKAALRHPERDKELTIAVHQ